MENDGTTLIFVEKKRNIFCLRENVKNILVRNVAIVHQDDKLAIVSDDNDMRALMSKGYESDSWIDDDDDDDEIDTTLVPLKKSVVETSIDKPSVACENVLKKNQITSRTTIDPSIPAMSINDAHHERAYCGEEWLRGMGRAKKRV